MVQLNIAYPPNTDNQGFDSWLQQTVEYLRDYLGRYDDAGEVSFYQTGTGALTRTMLAKIRETAVSLTDYGTFAQAVTAAAGKILVVPPGTHTLTGDLTVSADTTMWVQRGALFTGAYTLDIDGPALIGPYKVFDSNVTLDMATGTVPETYVEWWNDSVYPSDCASAFTKAISCGGSDITRIFNKQYGVNSTITPTKNRFRLKGGGLASSIYFNPTTNADVLFNVEGNKDNCWFEDLYLYYSNASSKISAGAVDITDSCNTINFKGVTIDSFDEYGIRHDEAMYDLISECRFINMDNSANNDHLAQALTFTTYGNNITIEKCRFSSNDQAIRVDAGDGIRVIDCSFEGNGDSGNTVGGMSTVYVSGVDGFTFKGNYVEGNRTSVGYAFLRHDNCSGIVIEGNTYNGDYGGTTYTNIMLSFDSDCVLPEVRGNLFAEVLQYFIESGGAIVNASGNKYIDGGAVKTAYNDIMALMSPAAFIELDKSYSFTWDPASIADNAGLSTTQSVTGTVLGDHVQVSCGTNLAGLLPYAYVSSAGTVYIRLYNPATAGAIDLASSTFYLKINKKK